MLLPGDEVAGVVEGYDDQVGAGWLVLDGDGGRLWFHCTAIADGSRHVDPGTRVRARAGAGHLGALEAVGVRPS